MSQNRSEACFGRLYPISSTFALVGVFKLACGLPVSYLRVSCIIGTVVA